MPSLRSIQALFSLLLFAVILSGCDSTDALHSNENAAATSQNIDAAVQSATKSLDLSSDQQANLRIIFDRYKGRRDEPGVLWRASADLQETLTDAQKAKLRERVAEVRARFTNRRRPPRMHHRSKQHLRGRRNDHAGALWKIMTAEQQQQARQLRKKQRAAFKALRRQRDELSNEAFREQARALRRQARADFRALLTNEQKAVLKKKREERKKHRKATRAVRAEVLALTGEQQEALKQLHQTQRAAHKQLRERLRDEGATNRKAWRGALRDLRQKGRRQAAAIFDERQQEITMIHRVLAFQVMKRRARRQHHR